MAVRPRAADARRQDGHEIQGRSQIMPKLTNITSILGRPAVPAPSACADSSETKEGCEERFADTYRPELFSNNQTTVVRYGFELTGSFDLDLLRDGIDGLKPSGGSVFIGDNTEDQAEAAFVKTMIEIEAPDAKSIMHDPAFLIHAPDDALDRESALAKLKEFCGMTGDGVRLRQVGLTFGHPDESDENETAN